MKSQTPGSKGTGETYGFNGPSPTWNAIVPAPEPASVAVALTGTGRVVYQPLLPVSEPTPRNEHSSVSVGIALFPDDGPDLNALLSKADMAMYKAKTSSPGHYVYCSADDADDAPRPQPVEELRTALPTGQLVVYEAPTNGRRPRRLLCQGDR